MHGKEIQGLAREYFHLMAVRYPTFCASDEFYLFPRAGESLKHLDKLDSIDEDKIKQTITDIEKLIARLEKTESPKASLDDRIDTILLKASMRSFLREWRDYKIQKRNPCLYLKLATVGFDLVFSGTLWKKDPGLLQSRLKMIPQITHAAKHALDKVPRIYQEIALDMAKASRRFFTNNVFLLFKESGLITPDVEVLLAKAVSSLDDFEQYLKSISTVECFAYGEELLSRLLKESYLEERDLPSILAASEEEYSDTIKEMERLARQISGDANWKKILFSARLENTSSHYILGLYQKEIVKLKAFLKEKGLINFKKDDSVEVSPTPSYLLPLRATASYRAATGGVGAVFYVTLPPQGLEPARRDDIANAIHTEYLFMSAHEVYPGHHVLDTARATLKNPVRRQLESPYFYEGWACYGEQLIQDEGYVGDVRMRLIGLKRRLWRSIRAALDVLLHTDRMTVNEAAERLVAIGYPAVEAYLQARQYTLTYGYQLCYTLGKCKMMALKNRYKDKLSLKDFHDTVLSCGEIPFSLLDEKLKEAAC